MTATRYCAVALLLILNLLRTTSLQAALPVLPDTERHKPILIAAEDLRPIEGLAIESLSLAAIVEDRAEPIPFQFDEYNVGGAVFFAGRGVALKGEPDLFDADDKLLFLYGDAGPRRQPQHRFDGKVLAEIELYGDDNQRRYVYVLQHSRLRADTAYVRYASAHGRVETDFYTLTYEPDNHLIWKGFEYHSFIGEAPLDTMKIRLQTGVISTLTEVVLKNDAFIGKPVAERIGPIRTTTQLEITAMLWNLPLVKVSAQLHHYPQALLYDIRLVVPEARRMLLVEPRLSVSMNGNNLTGMVIRTALGPTQPATVDGKIDAIERDMIAAGVTLKDNWIWASSKRGLDVVSYLDFLEASNMPLSLFYVDDADVNDPPQRFPGQLPNLGYNIDDFPREGQFAAVASMHLSSGYPGAPEVFTRQIRTLPSITVRSYR